MFKLNGKTALVTGATGGIGKAIAKIFAAAGANMVLTGSRQSALDELSSVFENNISTIRCDLANPAEVKELFTNAEKAFGAVDILVCNAGICRDNLAIRMKDEEWEEVIQMNLSNTFKLNRDAIKSMMKRRYGRIINISSVIGITGNIGQANYAASKAGMIGMSKSLALETASRGITVNCIAPGFVDTPMTQNLSDKIKEAINTRIPIGRIGAPEEIAAAVLFLASCESSYITGATLNINGGMLMN